MTTTGDFLPGDPNLDPGPSNPVVFGITLTPPVIGVLLALLGLGGAAYLFLNLVQPAYQRNQELEAKVQDQTAQLEQQATIQKRRQEAEANLVTARRQRQEVLSLFASPSSLNTALLDINRQITSRSAGLASARAQKLATCPAWVRNNVQEIEQKAGKFVIEPKLTKFAPDPKASGIIADGSYGALVNNKLKRQVAQVSFEGNFNQVQSILRSIERFQPLLVLKNVKFAVGSGQSNRSATQLYEYRGNTIRFLSSCQPETPITVGLQMEALLPLTPEELAKAAPPAQPAK